MAHINKLGLGKKRVPSFIFFTTIYNKLEYSTVFVTRIDNKTIASTSFVTKNILLFLLILLLLDLDSCIHIIFDTILCIVIDIHSVYISIVISINYIKTFPSCNHVFVFLSTAEVTEAKYDLSLSEPPTILPLQKEN